MTRTRPVCRSCGSSHLETIADLGSQPPADLFPEADDPGPDATWPLSLVACLQCHLLQTPNVEDAPPAEVPLATQSDSAAAQAAARVAYLTSLLGDRGPLSVREFRSPHGDTWMAGLVAEGWTPAGEGAADVVVDVQGLVHEDEFDVALGHRLAGVADGGYYVLEFHHALHLVRHGQLDLVRHGHPVYLSLIALGPALGRHGFVMLHAEPLAIYGGSLLLVCGRAGEPDSSIAQVLAEERDAGLDDPARLVGLGQGAAASADALHEWLRAQQAAGRLVLGYGAPSKAPALLNRAHAEPGLLPFVADRAPRKWGRRMPVTRIPIRSPEELIAADPDVVLILTWDIAAEVRSQLSGHGLECEYVVPTPWPTSFADRSARGRGGAARIDGLPGPPDVDVVDMDGAL